MPIMTSRGCPYKCTYCHDIQGKRFRAHSPEYVLKMIDDLGETLDVRHFDIIDDIFNFDPDRMDAICDGLLARQGRVNFTFPNGLRADRLKVPQVEKLAAAGCEYVALAIETVTPRLQKQIRKHLRFDKVMPVIDAFTRNDVFTCGFFMVGFPGETEEELRATLDFAHRSRLHAAFFFTVTPFQGTELHEQVAEHVGGAVRELTHLFVRQKVNLSEVPDRTFFRLKREGYLRFYSSPRRVVSIWRAFPRRTHLIKLAFVMLTRDTLRLELGRFVEPVVRARGWARRRLAARVPPPPVPAPVRGSTGPSNPSKEAASAEEEPPKSAPRPTSAGRRSLPIVQA